MLTSEESPAPSRFPVGPVAASALLTAMANLPAFLFGALAIRIAPELGFRTSGTGVAVAGFMAASAISGPLLGRFVQRLPTLVTARIALAATSAALLGIAFVADDLATATALLALAGTANACAQIASNLVLAERGSVTSDGTAFGIKQASVPVATALAGLSVPVFVGAFGWRWAFAIAGGLAVLVAVAMGRLVHGPAAGARPRRSAAGAPVAWGVVLWFTLGAFFAQGVSTTLAVFLVEYAVSVGWSSGAAGTLLAVCSLGVIAARVGAGVMLDVRVRRGGSPIAIMPIAVMIATAAIGMLLIMLGSDTPALLATGAFLALVLGWGWPGLMHLAIVSVHRGAAAVPTGVVLTGVFGGGVVMPVILGVVADRVSFARGWAINAAFFGASAVAFAGAHVAQRRRSSVD